MKARALLLIAMLLPAWAGSSMATPNAFLALQASRQVDRVALPGDQGEVVLTQLNPAVNAWLLLTVPAPDGRGTINHHLENADPASQRVSLDASAPGHLRIASAAGDTTCALWPGPALVLAARARLAYAPLCGGRLMLRNRVSGNRSTLEAMTGFLRDHVWGGERIIGFVKRELYRDAFVERAGAALSAAPADTAVAADPGAPQAATLLAGAVPRAIVADGLGIDLGPRSRALQPGGWVAAAGLGGVWISIVQPGSLAAGLDAVEAEALAYLVAFDLGTLELGFALGTDHPRLGWSARVPPERVDANLSGPDGFDSAEPLLRTGMLAPPLLERVVATFTGGFKREHGAFSRGALAAVNRGSHYGFVEQGVVFSRLQPGLATLLVFNDGSVEMKTWQRDDQRRLADVRHARQNGVPLVEPGPDGAPVSGRLVDHWSAGNWSGSSDEQLRTLRAGACLLENAGRRHLVYGYFSSATPRAMARVFGAYGCRYAMHLDMNALEHTYLALYPRHGAEIGVEHLVPGMAVLDRSVGKTLLPRFLGFGDSRDFFYLTRRKERR